MDQAFPNSSGCWQHRFCAEMFACGLDIKRVSILFNYDFPTEADMYMHCVGLAGRFGNKGMAIWYNLYFDV